MTTQNRISNFHSPPKPSRLRLPAELWLQILEQTTINDAIHLWTSVRQVSRQFRDYVERLFISVYIPKFSFSLALPRRDPTSGTLKWPGTPIPGAQIIMSFDCISMDHQRVTFKSPIKLKDGPEIISVEELRNASVLSEERLEDAPPWVYFNNNSLTGMSMKLPLRFRWDDERKLWLSQLNWRKLISHFYNAKAQSRFRPDTMWMQKRRVTSRDGWR